MKVLIMGDGLLGSEIHKQTGWDYISRKKDGIDFGDFNSYINHITKYDVILNCIAYTNTYDTERENHWKTNVKDTSILSDVCDGFGKKLVHISTDYIYANSDSNAAVSETVPVHHNSWYGYTKQIIDGYIQLKNSNHLIIRCSHKPTPYPYDNATTAIVGNFDYVDVIAKLIIDTITENKRGVYNIGTELKSIYDLAIKTKADVTKTSKLPVPNMPTNVSMEITK